MKNPFEFFGQTLSQISGKFAPEKFRRDLDELFAEARKDPQVTLLLALRKGDDAAVFLLQQGQIVNDPLKISLCLAELGFACRVK